MAHQWLPGYPWVLASGREMKCEPQELRLASSGLLLREECGDERYEKVFKVVNGLTRAEKREIADTVKPRWDAWVETGKP